MNFPHISHQISWIFHFLFLTKIHTSCSINIFYRHVAISIVSILKPILEGSIDIFVLCQFQHHTLHEALSHDTSCDSLVFSFSCDSVETDTAANLHKYIWIFVFPCHGCLREIRFCWEQKTQKQFSTIIKVMSVFNMCPLPWISLNKSCAKSKHLTEVKFFHVSEWDDLIKLVQRLILLHEVRKSLEHAINYSSCLQSYFLLSKECMHVIIELLAVITCPVAWHIQLF